MNDRPAQENTSDEDEAEAPETRHHQSQRIADLSVRLGRKRGTLAVGI